MQSELNLDNSRITEFDDWQFPR